MLYTSRDGHAREPRGDARRRALTEARWWWFAPIAMALLAAGLAGVPGAAAGDRPVTVRNDIGQPLEGANLWEEAAGGARVARGKSGADGLLAVPRALAPQGRFVLERAGHRMLALTGAELGRNDEFILVRSASVSGVVRDAAAAGALKGARVEIIGAVDERVLAEAAPDARGRFAAPDVEPGPVRVRARAAGSLISTLDITLAPGGTETVDLPIARPAAISVSPVAAAPDVEVRGVRAEIRKGEGFPRGLSLYFPAEPGAARSTSLGALPQSRQAEKDRPDVALIVPSGVPLELMFRVDGYAPARRSLVARAEAEAVRVPLERGAVLSGRLIDGEGRAVSGVTVRARYLDPALAELIDWDASKPAPSGDDGSFRLGALPPGIVALELVDSDWILPRLAPIQLPPEGADLGTIALRASAAILGRVVRRSNGAAVADARIRACLQELGCAWTAATRSGKNGSFRLTGLASGTWSVEAGHPDLSAARVDGIVPGSGAVQIELPDGGSLRGRVVGPDGGPLRRARIQLVPPDAVRASGFDRTIDTDEGRFDLTGVPPGRTTIRLRAPGYGPLRLESVEIRDGEPTDLGELVFFAGRVARGRVVRAGDSPVAGASITLRGDGSDDAGATSDPDGRFEVAGLPDGAFELAFRAAGLAPAAVAYPAAGAAESLELPERTVTLGEGGTIEGSVRGENDEPAGGARLRLPALPEVAPAITDLQGSYRLDHVPAGEVTIQMLADPAAPEGWTESRRAAVPEGGTVRVDFHEGGSIDGVVRRRGQPVAFARISAVAAGGTPIVHTSESGPDGTFRLHGIADGTWTIHVAGGECVARFAFASAPGTRDRRLELDVPPDDLSGWVLDESNGRPIASAEISWDDAAAVDDIVSYRMPLPSDGGGFVVLEDRPVAGAATRSLSDGSFRLCVPAAGALEIDAEAGDDYDEGSANVTLPARAPLTLELPPKGRDVRVVVLGPDGQRASSDAAVALSRRGGFYEVAPAGAGGEAKFARPKSDVRAWGGIPGVGIGASEWVSESADLTEPIPVVVPAGGRVFVRGLDDLRERAAAAGAGLDLRLVGAEGDDVYLWADALGVLESRRTDAGEELIGPFPPGRYTLSAFIGTSSIASAQIEISGDPGTVDLAPN